MVHLRQPCWFLLDGVRLPRRHKGWQPDQRSISGTLRAGVTRGHKANDAFRGLSTPNLAGFCWMGLVGVSLSTGSVAQRYCKKPLCYKAVGTFRGLSTLNPAGFFRYTSGAARSQGPMASHSAIQVAPYGPVLPCLTRQRAPVSSLPTRTLLVSAGCCTVEQISGESAAARSRSVPSR